MKYLLDSCALLWFAQGSEIMSESAFAAIEDPASEIMVSTVSFWELSIKAAVGKLPLLLSPVELERLTLDAGITVLPLIVEHIDRFHQLPVEHRDAFDRLIAAIALSNELTIVSPDSAFDTLGVRRLW